MGSEVQGGKPPKILQFWVGFSIKEVLYDSTVPCETGEMEWRRLLIVRAVRIHAPVEEALDHAYKAAIRCTMKGRDASLTHRAARVRPL